MDRPAPANTKPIFSGNIQLNLKRPQKDLASKISLNHNNPFMKSLLILVLLSISIIINANPVVKTVTTKSYTVTAPEINLKGNNLSIASGSATTSVSDSTDFPPLAVGGESNTNQVLQPDNLLYIIVMFSLCIVFSTSLLKTYAKDRLILISGLIFILCASRFVCEYYLPQIEIHLKAELLGSIQSAIVLLICLMIYYCIWSYVRPFRNTKNEKLYNSSFLFFLLILPMIVLGPPLLWRELYTFHPNKIAGYWQFSIYRDHWSYMVSNIYILVIMPITVLLIMLLSVKRRRTQQLKQVLIGFGYLIAPVLWYFITKNKGGDLFTPDIGFLYFSQAALVSWFVSDYRILENSYPPSMLPLLESIQDIAIFTNRDYQIVFFNNNAIQTINDIQKGASIWQLLYNYDNDNVEWLSEELAQDHSSINNKEINIIDAEGVLHSYQVRVSKYNRRTKLMGYTFIIINMSEAKRYENQLKELNTMKNNLMLVMTHDLKRPLVSFNDVASKINYLLSTNQYDRLNLMGKQFDEMTQSAKKISSEILEWTIMQMKSEVLISDYIDLKELLKDQIKSHQTYAKMHGHSFILQDYNPNNEVKVKMNCGAFQTIIRNIFTNAIEHSFGNSDIIVEISDNHNGYQVSITNSCLNPSHISFSSVKNILKKGKRVGLYIVQELIEKSGVAIDLEVDDCPDEISLVKVTIDIHKTNYVTQNFLQKAAY